MLTQELLEKVKSQLIQTYNPLEIYLFGSYAWGNPDEESDIDLLIIVKDIDPKDRYRIMALGHEVLFDIGKIGKEILVLSQKEFQDACQDKTRIFHKIKHKGKKIYAQA